MFNIHRTIQNEDLNESDWAVDSKAKFHKIKRLLQEWLLMILQDQILEWRTNSIFCLFQNLSLDPKRKDCPANLSTDSEEEQKKIHKKKVITLFFSSKHFYTKYPTVLLTFKVCFLCPSIFSNESTIVEDR